MTDEADGEGVAGDEFERPLGRRLAARGRGQEGGATVSVRKPRPTLRRSKQWRKAPVAACQ